MHVPRVSSHIEHALATFAIAAAAQVLGGPLAGRGFPPAEDEPVAGSAGVGDPYFPELGNGGYDVLHYALELDVDPVANHIDAVATLDATAEVALASFHLDFAGLEIASVAVDGAPAAFTREGSELVVTPARPLARASAFQVVVRYSGTPVPTPVPGIPIAGVGWLHFGDRVFTLSEPSGSMTWYPVNNHPRDKATYDFRVTVPAGWVAAANGRLLSAVHEAEKSSFHFRASDPMASYLATLNVAPFVVKELLGPGGLPLTFYFPEETPEEARDAFDRTPELCEALIEWFGPYPFETYGGVLMGERLGAALETQTLPVYGGRRPGIEVQVHELAHQWFGNSVTIHSWKDIWLAESFASYATWLWVERETGADALAASLEGRYRFLCRNANELPGDPGAERMFGSAVYVRGPLALHALRLRIGDEAFFGSLRAFAQRFGGRTATTEDFVLVCEELAGAELDPFFQAWLYTPGIPDIPEAALACADFPAQAPGERRER